MQSQRIASVCVPAMSLQSGPTLCDPRDCSPPGSSAHGIFQARALGWLPHPPLGDLPDSGIQPVSFMSPALQADSLLWSHQGRPQRIPRSNKKAFLSDQCKEIEENNRIGKPRDLFKKISDAKEAFHAKMGTIKERKEYGPNRSRKDYKPVARVHRRNIQKKILMIGITVMVCLLI